jgi:hypothetical protein
MLETYSATFKKNQTLTIYKKDGKLYMYISNGTGKHMLMQPLSDTDFLLPDVKQVRTTCEFVPKAAKCKKSSSHRTKNMNGRKLTNHGYRLQFVD